MSDLLAYLLKLDEPDERARVEARLCDDPDSVCELDALRCLVEPLEADREPPKPLPGLVARTIGLVAEHACGHGDGPITCAQPSTGECLPRRSPKEWTHVIGSLDRGGATPSRWRRADLAVAAAVLLVGIGLVLAALPYVRYRHGTQSCQNQLRQLYAALDSYAETHDGRFPAVQEVPPYNMASSFRSMLREAGALPASSGFACPAAGPHEFATYAYTLGYRDEAGALSGLRRDTSIDHLPIAGDRPAIGRTTPNPDHRYGQNILFAGGNVLFCATGHVGVAGDNIYRNQELQVRAGVKLWDTVLGVDGDQP